MHLNGATIQGQGIQQFQSILFVLLEGVAKYRNEQENSRRRQSRLEVEKH